MALLRRLKGEKKKLPLEYDLDLECYSTDHRSCKLTYKNFTVNFNEVSENYPFKGPFGRDITFALQGKM